MKKRADLFGSGVILLLFSQDVAPKPSHRPSQAVSSVLTYHAAVAARALQRHPARVQRAQHARSARTGDGRQ